MEHQTGLLGDQSGSAEFKCMSLGALLSSSVCTGTITSCLNTGGQRKGHVKYLAAGEACEKKKKGKKGIKPEWGC